MKNFLNKFSSNDKTNNIQNNLENKNCNFCNSTEKIIKLNKCNHLICFNCFESKKLWNNYIICSKDEKINIINKKFEVNLKLLDLLNLSDIKLSICSEHKLEENYICLNCRNSKCILCLDIHLNHFIINLSELNNTDFDSKILNSHKENKKLMFKENLRNINKEIDKEELELFEKYQYINKLKEKRKKFEN